MPVQLTPSMQYQPQFSSATSQQQVKFSAQPDLVQFSGTDDTDDTPAFEMTEKQVKLVEALGGDVESIESVEDIKNLLVEKAPKNSESRMLIQELLGLPSILDEEEYDVLPAIKGYSHTFIKDIPFLLDLGEKMGYELPKRRSIIKDSILLTVLKADQANPRMRSYHHFLRDLKRALATPLY